MEEEEEDKEAMEEACGDVSAEACQDFTYEALDQIETGDLMWSSVTF